MDDQFRLQVLTGDMIDPVDVPISCQSQRTPRDAPGPLPAAVQAAPYEPGPQLPRESAPSRGAQSQTSDGGHDARAAEQDHIAMPKGPWFGLRAPRGGLGRRGGRKRENRARCMGEYGSHAEPSAGSAEGEEEETPGGSPPGSMWASRVHAFFRSLASPVLITRIFLMVLLAVVTVVLSVVTWFAAERSFYSAVDTVAYQLRNQTLLRVDREILLLLLQNRDTISTYANLVEVQLKEVNLSQLTLPQTRQFIGPVAWGVFDTMYPHIVSLTYGQTDGISLSYTLLNVSSNPSLPSPSAQTNVSLIISGSKESPLSSPFVGYPVDQRFGNVIGPGTPAFGLREQSPEFLSTLQDNQPNHTLVWSLKAVEGYDFPLICTARAVALHFPNSMEFTGGVAVMAKSGNVNDFMATSSTLSGTTIYGCDSSGALFGTSKNLPLIVTEGNTARALTPAQFPDAVVSGTAAYLDEQLGLERLLTENTTMNDVPINGQPHFISTMTISYGNLRGYVVMVVPRGSVMAGIDQARAQVILIVVLIAFGTCVLGWLVIIGLTLYVDRRMRPKEELVRQQEETQRAQAANDVKSQFLANISHDLRTPMAGILGLIDIMLCEKQLTAEQEANLAQMKGCCASLLGLLNNLLDLAKVEAGKMQLEVLEFDIVGELESLVDMFSVQGLPRGTEVVLDLADDLERTVKGDPSRVRQVFANLLSNACKFTGHGSVVVRGWMKGNPPAHILRTSITAIPKHQLPPSYMHGDLSTDEFRHPEQRKVSFVFEVDDTGVGIPAHKKDLIFENFQQADPSTARKYGGTGLGLSIVKSLVELMGGGIRVVDKSGPGACFRFELNFELDQKTTWKNSMLQPEFLLPKVTSLEGGQVLLAMVEGSAGAQIASTWMQRRMLTVWRACVWEEVLPLAHFIARTTYVVRHRAVPEGLQQDSDSEQHKDGASAAAHIPTDVAVTMPSEGEDAEDPMGLVDTAKRSMIRDWMRRSSSKGSLAKALGSSGSSLPPDDPEAGTGLPQSSPHDSFKDGLASGSARANQQNGKSDFMLVIVDVALVPNLYQFIAEGIHDFRARLQAQGFVLAWLVEHSTSADTRRALRRAGCAVASKPLFASRLAPIIACATAAKATPISTSLLEEPLQPLTAASSGSPHENSHAGSHGQSPEDTAPQVTPDPSSSDFAAEGETPELQNRLASGVLEATHHAMPSTSLPRVPHTPSSPAVFEDAPRGSSFPGPSAALPGSAAQKPIVAVPEAGPAGAVARLLREERAYPGTPPPQLGEKAYDLGANVRSCSTNPSTPERRSEADTSGALAGKRVLIAEDTPLLRKVALVRMQKLGCTVEAVCNGQEAVDAVLARYTAVRRAEAGPATAEPPADEARGNEEDGSNEEEGHFREHKAAAMFDAVIMDCQMPVMDGYSATTAIREAEKGTPFHIPIVALTAHAMTSDKKRCLDAGMDDYLTKPIDPALMAKTLLDLMERYPHAH